VVREVICACFFVFYVCVFVPAKYKKVQTGDKTEYISETWLLRLTCVIVQGVGYITYIN